jgi:hypothetical protein
MKIALVDNVGRRATFFSEVGRVPRAKQTGAQGAPYEDRRRRNGEAEKRGIGERTVGQSDGQTVGKTKREQAKGCRLKA